MRDPNGSSEEYAEHFRTFASDLFLASKAQDFNARLVSIPEAKRIHFLCSRSHDYGVDLIRQYARGDGLNEVQEKTALALKYLVRNTKLIANAYASGETSPDLGGIYGGYRDGWGYICLLLLLLETTEEIATLQQFISLEKDYRVYLFDLMIKSFIPAFPLAKTYKPHMRSFIWPWQDPLVRILALPAAERPLALATHMSHWNRLMRGYGWKPKRDFSKPPHEGGDSLFCDFAFEVALVACAYDIDDGGCREHPYYPSDLVDFYRQHLRHSRDAWRAEGRGAGVTVELPPPPKKIDLAKSKSKGIGRWLELVSDGDKELIASVLETVGRPRKIDDLGELTMVLADENAGVHADIKDDETLRSQLEGLAAKRELGELDELRSPEGTPDAGPGRCEHLLEAGAQWFAARGYRLVDLDGEDDAWHAVLVKADYYDELLQLNQSLGIVVRKIDEDD